MNVPAGSGRVQYGNAAINDTYNSGDYTYFYVGSNVPMTVGAFIDPAETHVPANRYTATLTLHGTGIELISINNTIFFNPAGAQFPAGTPVYTVGFIDTNPSAHTIWIQRVRQLPPLSIPYYPGAIPFTANFLGQPATLVDWRGPVYMGYQSPWMWKQIGNATATANCVQMLADAQTQWHVQTGQPDTGPFAPVFYFQRSDAVQYGPANTFGWSGPDPSTNWGGYQYRPLAELAQLVAEAAGTESYFAQAVSVADTFLTFLDNHWTNATVGPPTDYFQGQAAQVNYQDPQMAALILRALLYMDKQKRPNGNASGTMNATYSSLLTKTLALYSALYQTTGVMAGTFCADTATQSWFGFWHGEILRSLAQLYSWASNANIDQPSTAAQALTWLNGMIAWAMANSQ